MRNLTKIINLPDIDKDILIEYDTAIENDGIGSYEFWGSISYDEGTDYIIENE